MIFQEPSEENSVTIKGHSGNTWTYIWGCLGTWVTAGEPGIAWFKVWQPDSTDQAGQGDAREKEAAEWQVFLSRCASLLKTVFGLLEREIMWFTYWFVLKKAGVERGFRGGVRAVGEGAGGRGQWIRGPLEPGAASTSQFCETPFKPYFKTEARGKCSHLSLFVSKVPIAKRCGQLCQQHKAFNVCQIVISRPPHLCRDLTLCKRVFTALV